MKKVLFLIHTLGGGGAEKVLVNLVNGMDKQKYNVTVMTVIDTGIFRKDLDSNIEYKSFVKIPFKKKRMQNDNNPGNLLSKSDSKLKVLAKIYVLIWKLIPSKIFYKLFIRDKYDVEVSFLEGICSKIISASTNKDSKKIGWIHVDLINHPKSSGVFTSLEDERKCYDKFDNIVCVSEVVRNSVLEKLKLNRDKVIVRYNAVNKEEILLKSQEEVSDLAKTNKFTFCTIGRLISQKGFDRLLRVHKQLVDLGYNCELWIIGEGNKRPMLEEYIKKNQLQSSVKLLGFRANPYKYLKLADAFVCSSRAEGFSTVASEAVILGKPIVTVNCSGMTELLGSHNEYGIVTENNEEALLQGMIELMKEDVYTHYLERVIERSEFFSFERAVRNIEELC
ncbi:MAG: glycosyltransferase [Turicibacter sp.]|nr:glycosyltransferase [Turicibacter sp.]